MNIKYLARNFFANMFLRLGAIFGGAPLQYDILRNDVYRQEVVKLNRAIQRRHKQFKNARMFKKMNVDLQKSLADANAAFELKSKALLAAGDVDALYKATLKRQQVILDDLRTAKAALTFSETELKREKTKCDGLLDRITQMNREKFATGGLTKDEAERLQKRLSDMIAASAKESALLDAELKRTAELQDRLTFLLRDGPSKANDAAYVSVLDRAKAAEGRLKELHKALLGDFRFVEVGDLVRAKFNNENQEVAGVVIKLVPEAQEIHLKGGYILSPRDTYICRTPGLTLATTMTPSPDTVVTSVMGTAPATTPAPVAQPAAPVTGNSVAPTLAPVAATAVNSAYRPPKVRFVETLLQAGTTKAELENKFSGPGMAPLSGGQAAVDDGGFSVDPWGFNGWPDADGYSPPLANKEDEAKKTMALVDQASKAPIEPERLIVVPSAVCGAIAAKVLPLFNAYFTDKLPETVQRMVVQKMETGGVSTIMLAFFEGYRAGQKSEFAPGAWDDFFNGLSGAEQVVITGALERNKSSHSKNAFWAGHSAGWKPLQQSPVFDSGDNQAGHAKQQAEEEAMTVSSAIAPPPLPLALPLLTTIAGTSPRVATEAVAPLQTTAVVVTPTSPAKDRAVPLITPVTLVSKGAKVEDLRELAIICQTSFSHMDRLNREHPARMQLLCETMKKNQTPDSLLKVKVQALSNFDETSSGDRISDYREAQRLQDIRAAGKVAGRSVALNAPSVPTAAPTEVRAQPTINAFMVDKGGEKIIPAVAAG